MPVGTEELIRLEKEMPRLKQLGVNVLAIAGGVTFDPRDYDDENHSTWIKDALHYADMDADNLTYLLAADEKGKLAKELGLIDHREMNKYERCQISGNAVMVVAPDKTVRLATLYPASIG